MHVVEKEKPNVSSSAAAWATLIFVGLIIAAINFVQAESNSEGHGGGHGAKTEHHEAGAGHEAAGHEAHEATTTEHAETAAPAAGHDSAEHGEHSEAPAAEPAHEEAHH